MSYNINKKTYHKDSSARKWVEYEMCVMIRYTQQAVLRNQTSSFFLGCFKFFWKKEKLKLL